MLQKIFDKMHHGDIIKVKNEKDYDFYIGITKTGVKYYNIVPENSEVPTGGFITKETIENIKKVKFCNDNEHVAEPFNGIINNFKSESGGK